VQLNAGIEDEVKNPVSFTNTKQQKLKESMAVS
jgi:hypothetical protein